MSEQTNGQAARRPKGRSPSYPAVHLESAIQRTRTLYDKERQHPTPVDTIVKHWGYKSANGPASLTLAALKKFGLVEDQGTGAARRAQVSDLAIDILVNPDQARRLAAIREAALLPVIHRDLWEKYGARLPSDDNLRWELTRSRGFTDTGANEFIPEYRATVSFAQLGSSGTVQPQDQVDGGATSDQVQAGSFPPEEKSPSTPGQKVGGVTGTQTSIPFLIKDGAPVVLAGEFPITETAWEQVMTVLAAMKPMLTRQDEQAED